MKWTALLCLPAALGFSARAETSRATPPARPLIGMTVDPAHPPGLPYLPDRSAPPRVQKPMTWDELFQRNPGLKKRLDALKQAHPGVTDWGSLLQMPGSPPSVNDLYSQYPDLEALAPRVVAPPGGKPPVVLALPLTGSGKLPLYRPSDRNLFKFQHPLLTPDTPARVLLIQPQGDGTSAGKPVP